MIRPGCSLVVALFGLVACANSTATAVGVTPSTAIKVDPAEFLGSVACADTPGGMRLYVATLTDVSPIPGVGFSADTVLQLPSSLPTSCLVPVLFESILDGRQYEAAVDGYDRTDIESLAPGTSVMVDHDTHSYVAPRWTTRCAHQLYPPPLRTPDGGLKPDAGVIEHADSGTQTNGGYLQCAPVPLYGPTRTPWLDGPVCAVNQQTITARGCDPLRD